MAVSRLRTCIKLSGIDIQPGDDHSAMDGLNTQFDIYANRFKTCNYAPDENVRRGYLVPGNANWCNAGPSAPNWPITNADATPLAVDENMISTDQQGKQTLNTNVAVGNGSGIARHIGAWHIFPGAAELLPPPGCTSSERLADTVFTNTR